MIETADRFHGPSETCEIYGVDCVGDQTIPDQLINYISLLLNQIWKSDKFQKNFMQGKRDKDSDKFDKEAEKFLDSD